MRMVIAMNCSAIRVLNRRSTALRSVRRSMMQFVNSLQERRAIPAWRLMVYQISRLRGATQTRRKPACINVLR